MSAIIPQEGSFAETSMPDGKGKNVSVVEVNFTMQHPIDDGLYNYITNRD